MKLTLMMAMSADGIIALDSEHLTDWTSSADKQSFTDETKKAGVVIFGRSTYATINRPLPGRLNFILTSEPEKFASQTQPGVLEFFKGSPEQTIHALEAKGFPAAILGGGAKTNAQFLAAGLVDELLLTIEPKIFGQGIRFTEGQNLDMTLRLLDIQKLTEDAIQLRYQVLKP
ncbi:dihydrofolate reductase [Candidatus Falkowbacteria bacterium]|nr:dihydrofolate reductase [Candidatus Falkowbacteria bacterium]